MAERFEKLDAFQVAVDVAASVYEATKAFPSDERFGLTQQLRRAATSIVSNIAEGYGRVGRGDYMKHLGYARGSAFEVKAQLMIARRVGLAIDDAVLVIVDREIKLLHKLIESLGRGIVREEDVEYGLVVDGD